jgi:hypothetical protein
LRRRVSKVKPFGLAPFSLSGEKKIWVPPLKVVRFFQRLGWNYGFSAVGQRIYDAGAASQNVDNDYQVSAFNGLARVFRYEFEIDLNKHFFQASHVKFSECNCGLSGQSGRLSFKRVAPF